jgi:ABC-type Fe3+-hydroxamate transport system substrate-binding protein
MRRLLLVAFLSIVALPCFASRTLTDEFGRSVVLPDHPHRLICLAPSVVDDVYQLGAGADVIAVSDFTKYPSEAAAKPSVGLPLNPSVEKILELHPDLILGASTLNQLESLRPLEKYGIPIFMVDPHGISGIYSSLTILGKVLNRETEARALIAKLQAREVAVHARSIGKPQVRVFMPIWYDPVVTIGKNDYITQLIAVAGGKSITDDIALPWPQVSMEAVIARNPEALLLVRGGKLTLKGLSGRPGWNTLRAIKESKVYFVDDRINLPSPAAFDALEDLVRQFHP